ncbi:MAG: hypothetical protein PHS14_10545 [Elusimicrobia bacterium]|nr:hypothetical protein [Elusimicrobiota bacterium]
MNEPMEQPASTTAPSEGKVYDIAEIIEAVVKLVQDMDEKLTSLCAAHEALDKEIHEDFFGPIHKQYQEHVRGQGIEGVRAKYGARFGELAEPLKAFGIEDVFERLYDALEELKKGEGYKDEDEGPFVDGIFSQAMDRISRVRGQPPKPPESPEPPKEEPSAVEKTTVTIGGDKPTDKPPAKTPKKWSPAMDL